MSARRHGCHLHPCAPEIPHRQALISALREVQAGFMLSMDRIFSKTLQQEHRIHHPDCIEWTFTFPPLPHEDTMETPTENLVTMQIQGLIVDPVTEAPIVVLRQDDAPRFLPIWIGHSEAKAIAMTLEGVEAPRPMTHDLVAQILTGLDAELLRIEIHSLVSSTFYARLVLSRNGEVIELDARPSDAMAVALRADAPILVAESVLEQAKAQPIAETESEDERIKDILSHLDEEDLGDYTM